MTGLINEFTGIFGAFAGGFSSATEGLVTEDGIFALGTEDGDILVQEEDYVDPVFTTELKTEDGLDILSTEDGYSIGQEDEVIPPDVTAPDGLYTEDGVYLLGAENGDSLDQEDDGTVVPPLPPPTTPPPVPPPPVPPDIHWELILDNGVDYLSTQDGFTLSQEF